MIIIYPENPLFDELKSKTRRKRSTTVDHEGLAYKFTVRGGQTVFEAVDVSPVISEDLTPDDDGWVYTMYGTDGPSR